MFTPMTYPCAHHSRLQLKSINHRYDDLNKAINVLQESVISFEKGKIEGKKIKKFIASLGYSPSMEIIRFFVQTDANGMGGLFSDLSTSHLFYSELLGKMNDLVQAWPDFKTLVFSE